MVGFIQKPRLSRVNARHLLDDIAGSYSHSLDDTVLAELVANALDAGADRVSFAFDQAKNTFSVTDNGRGMDADTFERYHDLAESSKARGNGIGFAGLGAKLAHSLASRVVTETRSPETHMASEWGWKGDDLTWKLVRRRALRENGTQVSLSLNKRGERLVSPAFIEGSLRAYYGALLDPDLSQFYVWDSVYPAGVEFVLNGAAVPKQDLVDPAQADTISRFDITDGRGRRVGRAVFAVMKQKLPEGEQGIVLSTYGKLIRRDTLGLFPRSPERIKGWVEVPGLVECLTLNKQDFMEHGTLGEKYRRLRRLVQKAYNEWLAEVGQNVDQQEARRAPRTLERELSAILRRLPELRYLSAKQIKEELVASLADGNAQGDLFEGIDSQTGDGPQGGGASPSSDEDGTSPPPSPGAEEGRAAILAESGAVYGKAKTRRTQRGPTVRLTSDSGRNEMSWVEGDIVYVNTAHPTYVKAQREGQVRYHRRLVVLLALCEEAPVEDSHKLHLLARAVTQWGSG